MGRHRRWGPGHGLYHEWLALEGFIMRSGKRGHTGVVPFDLDGGSGGDGAHAGSWGVSVDVASKVGIVDAHDGVVVWWLTDTGLGGTSTGVGGPEPLKGGVGVGSLGQHGRNCEGGESELHLEVVVVGKGNVCLEYQVLYR